MLIEVSTYINELLSTVNKDGDVVDETVPELWMCRYALGTQVTVTGPNGMERNIPFEVEDTEPIGVVRDRLVQMMIDAATGVNL